MRNLAPQVAHPPTPKTGRFLCLFDVRVRNLRNFLAIPAGAGGIKRDSVYTFAKTSTGQKVAHFAQVAHGRRPGRAQPNTTPRRSFVPWASIRSPTQDIHARHAPRCAGRMVAP
jgi:hypothetical protein